MGYFSDEYSHRSDQQYLAGGTWRNWRQLKASYGVDPEYAWRGRFVAATTLATKPLRWIEENWYANRIRNTRLNAPLFIIGHWRSGTTFLQRLLTCDPGLVPVSTLQTVMPGMFLIPSPFSLILKNSIPDVRPMDEVRIGIDESEEDEYALGNLPGTSSYYNALSFPRQMSEIFDQSVLFKNQDEEAIEKWLRTYYRFMQKVALKTCAHRLVLKNPANSARIPLLLRQFPDARFIFIYREPVTVYQSTMHWFNHELDMLALQRVSQQHISESVLRNYTQLIGRYLEDRERIPEGNLVEVCFEELEQNPVNEVIRLLDSLSLDYAHDTPERIAGYVASLGNYRKNRFVPTDDIIENVHQRWNFAFREWNYS